jgi:glycosyltransferase involved in cell wall biosynthesis
MKDQLTQQIITNNVQNINLRGAANDISKEYANSSICAVTSYFEGFSLVILEAMKHGVPCVAFDCPNGPRNIIVDRENGFLVEDGNYAQYIEKLCTLIENEQLRQQYSESSKMRAHDFDIDKIMTQWKNLFEELL